MRNHQVSYQVTNCSYGQKREREGVVKEGWGCGGEAEGILGFRAVLLYSGDYLYYLLCNVSNSSVIAQAPCSPV